MDVEIGKMPAAETPASSMSEYVVEHVVAIMTMCGIESIDVKKYSTGFGSRLHVSIAPFSDAPEEITNQGVVAKDAIAQILSIANITRIVIKPSDDDISGMKDTWKNNVSAARSANRGSGQDFTDKEDEEEDGE